MSVRAHSGDPVWKKEKPPRWEERLWQGTQNLPAEESAAVLSPPLPSTRFPFRSSGEIRPAPPNHRLAGAFHASPAWDQRKRGGSSLHRPDEPIPAHKTSTCFSALASRTRSAAAFAVPRRSGSRGYVVSISLHLLPSNWPSRKELGNLSGGGAVPLPITPAVTRSAGLLLGTAEPCVGAWRGGCPRARDTLARGWQTLRQDLLGLSLPEQKQAASRDIPQHLKTRGDLCG